MVIAVMVTKKPLQFIVVFLFLIIPTIIPRGGTVIKIY